MKLGARGGIRTPNQGIMLTTIAFATNTMIGFEPISWCVNASDIQLFGDQLFALQFPVHHFFSKFARMYSVQLYSYVIPDFHWNLYVCAYRSIV